VVDFLGHLLRHLPGKLLMVWDGLPQHRAGLVGEFIRAQRGRLAIEWLPGYAPELNPLEYTCVWRIADSGEISNSPHTGRRGGSATMMFANRISSSTSCLIWLPETSPPSSARGLLRHRFQSCNTSPRSP
jgi:transposase